MRQSEAIGAGFTKRELASAVTIGGLQRVRRSWLVADDADPMTVAAARNGVVLSCITLAARRGLWVLTDGTPHVAAPSHSGGVSTRAERVRLHWGAPIVPRHPNVLEDSLENALVLVASCQAREAALTVWESALRLGLVDRQIMERLPLPARARDILACATPFSDSGLETFVLVRLKWMKVRIVPQVVLCRRPVDFLIGERLVLQIDGGHHVGPQRDKDIVHDAELMLRGYHVIRVGYRQVVHDWPAVQERIMRAVAQGLHLA